MATSGCLMMESVLVVGSTPSAQCRPPKSALRSADLPVGGWRRRNGGREESGVRRGAVGGMTLEAEGRALAEAGRREQSRASGCVRVSKWQDGGGEVGEQVSRWQAGGKKRVSLQCCSSGLAEHACVEFAEDAAEEESVESSHALTQHGGSVVVAVEPHEAALERRESLSLTPAKCLLRRREQRAH
eukprot:6192796-Pleurochrysis_carterae.AAC.3